MQPTCWYGVRRRWDSIIADKLTDTMLARGGDGSGVPQSLASRKNSGGQREAAKSRLGEPQHADGTCTMGNSIGKVET